MSDNGGAPHGADEPTSFQLPPPHGHGAHPQAPSGGPGQGQAGHTAAASSEGPADTALPGTPPAAPAPPPANPYTLPTQAAPRTLAYGDADPRTAAHAQPERPTLVHGQPDPRTRAHEEAPTVVRSPRTGQEPHAAHGAHGGEPGHGGEAAGPGGAGAHGDRAGLGDAAPGRDAGRSAPDSGPQAGAPGGAAVPAPTLVEPPSAPRPGAEPGAGRLIAGRYRLLAKLGHGGMGTVWRAKDETVDREVAVKEPRLPEHLPERERANAYERMRREARATARLAHPSVVSVHDVAVVDGRPWIVMELVRGRSLGDVLQEGTLGTREAARIGLEVLGALEAAHAAGVLHRDVKPDNVLLGQHGRVVLTDFGIAQIEGETRLTDTGGFVGSPEYIAPERVMGRRPGPEADLWSLGVVLYAATEGVSPFRRSNTPATLQSVLNSEPAPPSAASGPLAEAITGLLAKEPERRPGAAEVRALLERALRPPEPPAVRPAPAAPDGRRKGGIWLGRKALTALGAAIVAAAVAVYFVVADPFAGPLPDGWRTKRVETVAATVAVPAHYVEKLPEKPDEHWVTYTDPSGAVWVGLRYQPKDEDTRGQIAGSAAAEMYEDDRDFTERGSYDLAMPQGAETSPEGEIRFRGRPAARNTIRYDTTDRTNPRPRELQILYYRTSKGDMYKLTVSYPGAGDFTERGREVAETAFANLDVDTL